MPFLVLTTLLGGVKSSFFSFKNFVIFGDGLATFFGADFLLFAEAAVTISFQIYFSIYFENILGPESLVNPLVNLFTCGEKYYYRKIHQGVEHGESQGNIPIFSQYFNFTNHAFSLHFW